MRLMKTTLSILVLCASLAASRGDTVQFNLSPAGTDSAVGLSPANVSPVVLTSTGSGNTISGGITLQTTNDTLTFAIGYGSAAGFTDLTGAATTVSLNGPAPTNTAAPVVVDLGPFNFPAGNPAQGGVVFGSVTLTSGQVSDLLAGLNYVQIATASNAGGEIRGQLIPVPNAPPTLICPADATMECTGQPIPLAATVADANGDALQVVWSVNGSTVQTNLVPQGSATNGVDIVLAANLSLGTNIIGITVSDTSSNQTSCSSTIILQDTIPPVITSAKATPASLWPPNHKLEPISLNVVAQDICCTPTWKIISVTSNEPVGSGNANSNDTGTSKNNGNGNGKGNGKGNGNGNGNGNGTGSGHTAPDWVITGDHGVSLRAERKGNGSGRVYTITVQAQDCAGNLSAPVEVTVTVPHDQGHH
jgi:hypothetical protein